MSPTRQFVAMLLSLAVFLAACGGDGGESATDEAADGTGSTEAAGGDATSLASNAEVEPVTIRLGTLSEGLNYWCTYAAIDEGFYAEAGIEIPDPIVFGSDPDTGRALFAGEVDIALGGLTSLIPVEQGQVEGVRMIGSIADPMFALIGAEGIESLEDLVGATVVLPPQDASASIFAQAVINDAVGEGAWEPLYTSGGTPARVASVQGGQGDAAMVNSPAAENFGTSGEFNVVTYLAPLADDTSYETGGYLAMDEFLQSQREAVVAFMGATDRGCEFLEDPANREAVEQGLMDRYELTPEAAAATYDEYLALNADAYHITEIALDRGGVQNLLDLMVEAGAMDGTLELEEIIDNSFIEEARGA